MLPQEIVEMIIDYLEDDKAALKACSLVCHSWIPRSGYLLFRRCRINLLCSSPQEIQASLRPPQTRSTYIQSLTICGGKTPSVDAFVSIDCADLSNMLRFLPNLSSLVLQELRLHSNENFQERFGSRVPRCIIGEVHLRSVLGCHCSKSRYSLLDFLSIFSNINTLSVTKFSLLSDKMKAISELAHKVTITHVLGIRMRDFDLLGELLDKGADMHCIKHCGVSIMSGPDMDHSSRVNKFLRRINRGQLKVLELDFRLFFAWWKIDRNILDTFTREISHSISSIIIHTPFHWVNLARQLDVLFDFLCFLQTATITYITLHLYISCDGLWRNSLESELIKCDWSGLISAIDKLEKFKQLTLYIALQDQFEETFDEPPVERFSGVGWFNPLQIFEDMKSFVEGKLNNLRPTSSLCILRQQSTSPTLMV